MKSRSFNYVRACSLGETLAVLDRHGDEAKILAGGQSLVPAMSMRVAAPAVLVDVAMVPDLHGITVEDGFLRIGAMCRHADVLESGEIVRHAPLIAAAMPHIAHPAIRNRGTFGGSVCNADPAAELPACTLALGAQFEIHSSRGVRSVSADQFFLGTYTTCLEPTEVLVAIRIPRADAQTRSFFDECARRRGDYAMAGLAAHTVLRDGRIGQTRFVFFGVGEKPLAAPRAQATLEGRAPGEMDAEALSGAICAGIEPMGDLTTSGETKAHLMRVLTRRALRSLARTEE